MPLDARSNNYIEIYSDIDGPLGAFFAVYLNTSPVATSTTPTTPDPEDPTPEPPPPPPPPPDPEDPPPVDPGGGVVKPTFNYHVYYKGIKYAMTKHLVYVNGNLTEKNLRESSPTSGGIGERIGPRL